MDQENIIMYGLTEGQCGLLTILYNFGDQDISHFKKESVARLLELGYATFDIATQTFSITDKGKEIGFEATAYKTNRLKEVK